MDPNLQPNDSDAIAIKFKSILSAIGFLLILIGQIYQYSTPLDQIVIIPTPFWISLAGGIVFVLAQVLPVPRVLLQIFDRWNFFQLSLLRVLAVVFSILTIMTMMAFQKFERGGYIPVIYFWLMCGLTYLASFIRFTSFKNILAWIKTNQQELLVILAITVTAAIIRFYQLGVIPRVLDGDEGLVGMAAISTTSDRLANPFEYFENIGSFYLQMMNMGINLLGQTSFALRFLPALGGVLAIPATYLLARELIGRRFATLSAMTIAISHAHIHFSRIASVLYIQDTWMIPLELYFLFGSFRKKSYWRAAAAGILLAFEFNFYLTSQIIIAYILVFLFLCLIFFRKWIIGAARQIGVFVGGFLLMSIPQIIVIFQAPDEFFNRLNNGGTFQSGWLADMVNHTGVSPIQVLFERVAHSFFSIILYPNMDFYGAPIPMLTLVSVACFILGITVALIRTGQIEYFFMNGLLWAFVISVGMFSTPPSSDTYRLLGILPVIMIFVALGLNATLEILQLGWDHSRYKYSIAIGTVMIFLTFTNIWTYYGEFHDQCVFEGSFHGRYASYLGSFANTVNPAVNIYMLRDDIFFAGSHSSTEYLSKSRVIVNISDPIDSIQLAPGDVIVAPATRMDELRQWANAHPGGTWIEQFDCKRPILLAYTLP